MTTTLAALLRRPELGLVVRAGARGLDRPVHWVHTSELIDPVDFLEGGELLLTTGIGAGRTRSAQVEYVRRLHAAGVAGLGVGTGLTWSRVPAALATEAEDLGLPVLEVPREVPFIAISKAVAAAVAAEQYAEVTRAYQAQRALTSAAVRTDGANAVVRQLARRLSAWVLLLDHRGAVRTGRAEHAEALRPELARLRAAAPPSSSTFSLGGNEITVQALGAGRRVRGFLAVGRQHRLSPTEQHVLTTAAALLTVGFERSNALDAAQRTLRTGLLRLALGGQHELALSVAGELWGDPPAAPLHVAVLGGTGRGAAIDLLEDRGDALFHADLDGELVVLLAEVTPLAELREVHVGVSEPTDYADLGRAHEQARRALGAARRSGAPLVHFAELAAGGVLHLVDESAARAFAESLLAPLLAHDATGRGELVTSLRAWLGQHGQWDPAAARLGVHRHTLRHRIGRVEQLLGRSLDSADLRAELWLALRALP
ncbi:PucR family transcriptional regulator [Kutzneria viridogrisea]|uniref:Purine catabolism regulator n=1 Tax=Kutzneria viridogrisea TaxID=47990 RepID=A0ABR6BP77_9PSEU|nr:purine catabolism regulator [Kutzneria viridogrisea]